MPKTTIDFTYESKARRVSLFIPAGTDVQYVGTNAGLKTPTNYAVSRPQELHGCNRFDAEHYWYWVPDDIIDEA